MKHLYTAQALDAMQNVLSALGKNATYTKTYADVTLQGANRSGENVVIRYSFLTEIARVTVDGVERVETSDVQAAMVVFFALMAA